MVYTLAMFPLGLRLSVEVRAENDFTERMFREPHKSDMEAAFRDFSASLVAAMDGRLAVGEYRIDKVFNMPAYYYVDGQEPDDG